MKIRYLLILDIDGYLLKYGRNKVEIWLKYGRYKIEIIDIS